MVSKVKSEDDYLIMKDAYYQYLGNRNIMKENFMDQLLLKALEIGKPELAFDLIENHAELLIHPKRSVMM